MITIVFTGANFQEMGTMAVRYKIWMGNVAMQILHVHIIIHWGKKEVDLIQEGSPYEAE